MLWLNGLLYKRGLADGIEPFAACLAQKVPVTTETQIAVFKAWAMTHPNRFADPDYLGVIDAFRERWPCDNSN
jgi:hypothetical protein